MAARETFFAAAEKADKLCGELNSVYGTELELVTVDSNIHEVLHVAISDGCTLRDAGAALVLERLLARYDQPSTWVIDHIGLDHNRKAEPWLLSCLSTPNLKLRSQGTGVSRLEKVKYISQFPITYDKLSVCAKRLLLGTRGVRYENQKNCSLYCEKCRRTAMELMAVGKLEQYQACFDVQAVMDRKEELYAEATRRKEEYWWDEIYDSLLKNGEIRETRDIDTKNISDENKAGQKPAIIINYLDRMLRIRQADVRISRFLEGMGIRSVAIYGMGVLGQRLYRELRDSEVEVRYAIDRNAEQIITGLKVVKPSNALEKVDLILFTPVCEENVPQWPLVASKGTMTMGELLERTERLNSIF